MVRPWYSWNCNSFFFQCWNIINILYFCAFPDKSNLMNYKAKIYYFFDSDNYLWISSIHDDNIYALKLINLISKMKIENDNLVDSPIARMNSSNAAFK